MIPSFCDGIDRRGFLRMGSAAGLSLAQLLRLQASHAADKLKTKDINCIFIFTLGGMHVFYDGFIWKLRRPVVAQSLGI